LGSGAAIAAKARRASRTRRGSGPWTAMSWAEIGRGAGAGKLKDAERPPCRHRLVGRGGLGPGLLVKPPHPRIDAPVDRVEAGERRPHHLAAGSLPRANERGQLGRVETPEIGRGGYRDTR